MKVFYTCSELGLGHAARTIALGKYLEQRGHEIYFFSGGKSYYLLKKEFQNVFYCSPVSWYENSSGIVTSASIINMFFPLFYYNSEEKKFGIKSSNAMEVIHRYYELRAHLRKIEPDIVIADGDINALRLAQRTKIPSVYITNLIRPSYGFSSLLAPGERLTETYVKNCTKIIIPDNPPPYTVCEYNLGDLKDVGVQKKIEFVGSFFDTTPLAGLDSHIFAPVSGPSGTRVKILRLLLPVLEKLDVKSIVSLGMFGEKKSGKIGNCELHTWLTLDQRISLMKNASVVIFSGGHITCFETIKYLKPVICIPTQPEQMANAVKLSDVSCGLIAKNPSQLKLSLKNINEKHKLFKNNVVTLNSISNKYDGLKRATEIIESVKQ